MLPEVMIAELSDEITHRKAGDAVSLLALPLLGSRVRNERGQRGSQQVIELQDVVRHGRQPPSHTSSRLIVPAMRRGRGCGPGRSPGA